MNICLRLTEDASEQLAELESSDKRKLKRVRKCLGLLQANPRHPGLSTHKMTVLKTSGGQPVFQSYVENNTPSAWRVFWHYGPNEDEITVIAITPHP